MATVTATGPIGKRCQMLETMIAASTTFQSWVGVSGDDVPATSALAHIHMPWSTATTAHAVITPISGHGLVNVGRGTACTVAQMAGPVVVLFWAPIATAYASSDEDGLLDFLNKAEGTMKEAAAYSGKDGYATISYMDQYLQTYADDDEAGIGKSFEIAYAVDLGEIRTL